MLLLPLLLLSPLTPLVVRALPEGRVLATTSFFSALTHAGAGAASGVDDLVGQGPAGTRSRSSPRSGSAELRGLEGRRHASRPARARPLLEPSVPAMACAALRPLGCTSGCLRSPLG